MIASSVSTYLDVTQAANGASGSARDTAEADAEAITRAAQILAAIHSGADIVTQIQERTSLATDEVVAGLSWLSSAGLVKLEGQDGALHALLTEPAAAALNSA